MPSGITIPLPPPPPPPLGMPRVVPPMPTALFRPYPRIAARVSLLLPFTRVPPSYSRTPRWSAPPLMVPKLVMVPGAPTMATPASVP